MDSQEKVEFDALVVLRDHAWREFENKSVAEWRLSFSIWATILAAAGAVISAENFAVPDGWRPVFGGLLIAIVIVQLLFLRWVQWALERARETQGEVEARMRTILHLPAKTFTRRPWWQQPTVWVQAAISILLEVVLYVALISKAG